MDQSGIVFIGAGEAGVSAAATLRTEGYDGPIIVLNDEPDSPYQRPPLSKEFILENQHQPAEIKSEAWFQENDIDLRLGARVLSVHADKKLLSYTDVGNSDPAIKIEYDKLLIATGARARMIDNLVSSKTHVLRTQLDASERRSELNRATDICVVGAGVIGLEVASTVRALGKNVTVLDIASRAMGRALAPELSEFLVSAHTLRGVEIHMNERDIIVEESADKLQISSEKNAVAADLLLAGCGVQPNVELAKSIGCDVDNGIIVDADGATSIPDIYAAGDVANFYHPFYGEHLRLEAWRHAINHAAHVARRMLDKPSEYAELPWFWTDQLGMNIQVVGLAAQAERTVWRYDGDAKTAFHFAGDTLIAATTIDNGRVMTPLTRLIASRWSGDVDQLLDTSTPLAKTCKALIKQSQLVQ